jgi:transposase-like protein
VNKPRRLSQDSIAYAMESMSAGVTVTQAAVALGVDPKTLRRTLVYAERYGYWTPTAPTPTPSVAQVQRIAARKLGIRLNNL